MSRSGETSGSRSYLRGHSGISRPSSRQSGGNGRLRESAADLGHGSARLLWRADLPHRLTTSPARDVSPAWKPDGSQIAFARLDVVRTCGSDADKVIVTVLQFTSPPAGGDASESRRRADPGNRRRALVFQLLAHREGQRARRWCGCRICLAGSVRTAGNVVRIVRQLTEAANSRNLWSDSYDRRVGAGSFVRLVRRNCRETRRRAGPVHGATRRPAGTHPQSARRNPSLSTTPQRGIRRHLQLSL